MVASHDITQLATERCRGCVRSGTLVDVEVSCVLVALAGGGGVGWVVVLDLGS